MGKRASESIEKTANDSSHPHARPLSRRTGEGRLWDRFLTHRTRRQRLTQSLEDLDPHIAEVDR